MSDSGYLPSDVRGLGLGLLFGNDELFSPGFRQLVKLVGVTHLVAASGANLRFVLVLPTWLVGKVSWRLWQVVSLVLIGCYWLVAEQSGSLWRASLMWLYAWMASMLGRSSSPKVAWCLATLASWLLAPNWLTHSYWLSSLAIGGVVFSQQYQPGETNNRLLTHAEKRMKNLAGTWLVGALVFLAVMGYLWWQFASFEPVGILTTFLLEPLVPIYLWISVATLGSTWLRDNFSISSWTLAAPLNKIQRTCFGFIWIILVAVQWLNDQTGRRLSYLVLMVSMALVWQWLVKSWQQRRQRQRWRRVVCC